MNIFNKASIALPVSVAIVLMGPVIALAAGPAGVNLGDSGDFVILAKTGISTTGSTAISGDIGISPAAATYITGFALNLSAGSAFATSPLVSGKVYAPGYADPTPANMTAAVGDMETAYTDAMGRTNPTATELGAGNIGGLTIAPGLYKWGTGVTIPTDVTLSGGANDVWIFQIAETLTMSSATEIVLSGGAQASNIFWAVAGQTTLGTGAVFSGTILDKTAIVLNTGAQLNGRALAQSAVTLDANAVTKPSGGSSSTPTPTPTPTNTSNSDSNNSTSAQTPNNTQTGSSVSSANISESQFTAILNLLAGHSTANIPATKGGGPALDRDLWMGTSGTDVKNLQQYLNMSGFTVAASGAGSLGSETTFFGPATKAALVRFQIANGISPAVGYLGPITRSYISAQY